MESLSRLTSHDLLAWLLAAVIAIVGILPHRRVSSSLKSKTPTERLETFCSADVWITGVDV